MSMKVAKSIGLLYKLNHFLPETILKGWSKVAIFHYCVYCKFVTIILFVAISQSFTEIK